MKKKRQFYFDLVRRRRVRVDVCDQDQDTVDAEQGLRDAGVVRPVDDERGRARKRIGHTAHRGPGARAHRRGAGQDPVVVQEGNPERLLPGRRSGPVRRAHVPPAPGRRSGPIQLDTVAQDLPGSE